MHSKIDGPAAYDVLKNFEERWLKASKRSGSKKPSKLSRSHNDTLLWIEKIPDIIAIDDEIYSNDNDPERWDVQVSPAKGSINQCKKKICYSWWSPEHISLGKQIFRSIDSNSVKGFPKDPREATSKVNALDYTYVDHICSASLFDSIQTFALINRILFVGKMY